MHSQDPRFAREPDDFPFGFIDKYHVKETSDNILIINGMIANNNAQNNKNIKFLRVLLSYPNIDINSKYIFCKKQNGFDNGFEKSKIESGTALHMAICNHNSKIINCLLHYLKTEINQKFQIIYKKKQNLINTSFFCI